MTAQHPPLEALRYRQAGPVQLYLGDARQVLAVMPAASVDCIVTSPPFWSLRDYGTGTWRGGDPSCPHPAATMNSSGARRIRIRRSRPGCTASRGTCAIPARPTSRA